jgi:hypothetical protein
VDEEERWEVNEEKRKIKDQKQALGRRRDMGLPINISPFHFKAGKEVT